MYSYEDRFRTIELYIEYGQVAAATAAPLGYPSTKQLNRWYQKFKYSDGLSKRSGKNPKTVLSSALKLFSITCAQANLFL